MIVKMLGIVTSVDSYERDGVLHGSVGVGVGQQQAYNCRVANWADFKFGDVVLITGDLNMHKGGSFIRNERLEVASAADRAAFTVEVAAESEAA